MKTEVDDLTLAIVLEHGKEYTPALLPYDLPRGEVGQCFDMCALTALHHRKYKYVEGIASDPLNPDRWILHAWLSDGEHAFDITWRALRGNDDQVLPCRYIGIEMPIEGVAEFMSKTEYQGVIANRRRLPQVATRLIGAPV